ncbi:GNAT family N-acetyltransferase [uncultured Sulfitobacter sp.]|uniref:GNAT family N-acetyltransferase n=1 Tax=uncultured Sulfitobacter sp. TaxID=191468 RepID=UPI002634D56C|nr:GNAT family N-acetyltransferase [uncultured Sulfitobacter sp.]
MTPVQMAEIHQAAFVHERGWQADEFTQLLEQPFTDALTTEGGFAITRTLAGESELLILAVAPTHQRRGIAGRLMMEWTTKIQATAETAFLEVAADNQAAIALYIKHGFARTGLRKAYYKRTDAPAADAMLMSRALTQG